MGPKTYYQIVMKTKAQYRKVYKAKRNAMSDEQRRQISLQIVDQLLESPFYKYSRFMVFMPIKRQKEIDLQAFVEYLWKDQKEVFLPRVEGEKMEVLRYIPETILETNEWGISEPIGSERVSPKQIEVCLVPMLICDEWGNRIGYGKGYYDRFFTETSKAILKIGVNYFPPIEGILPHESTDVALDHGFTGEGLFSFDFKS